MARLEERVPEYLAGLRVDQGLAELFDDYSRSKLQTWIKDGRVLINGLIPKPKDRLEGGEQVELEAEPELVTTCEAENIPLDIVYEDEALIIVNKPAGLVVHPAQGNWSGTLQNALLNHDANLATLPRAGIVHRIDKDTSGLLMVAKTLQAHHSLVDQLQERSIEREYLAVTKGRMISGGTVDEPIGRHPTERKQFAVRMSGGKDAVTHYRVIERFTRHSFIQVQLETGRTHQIRVHMAHIKFPLIGDPMYGGRFQMPANCSEHLKVILKNFKRQALHAAKLGLVHPLTDEYMEWEQDIPDDMHELLEALRDNDAQQLA